MTKVETSWRLVPVRQIPVVIPGYSEDRSLGGWQTGVQCPECQNAEIVYNGNYFCSKFVFSSREPDCTWALHNVEEEDDPDWTPDGYGVAAEYRDLVDALYTAMNERHGFNIQVGTEPLADRIVQAHQVPEPIVGEPDPEPEPEPEAPPKWSETPEGQFHYELKKLGYIE